MEINFGDDINDVRGSVLVVPEPSNWVLMLVGLLTCSTVAKRRRNAWPRGVNTTARFAVCLPFVCRLFAVSLGRHHKRASGNTTPMNTEVLPGEGLAAREKPMSNVKCLEGL
jgi:hypothetical protein